MQLSGCQQRVWWWWEWCVFTMGRPGHGRGLCGQHYMSYKHLDMKWLLCLPQRNGFLVGIGSVRMWQTMETIVSASTAAAASAAAADTVVFVVVKTIASL